MSQITRTLAANQSESISASGSRIYVMQATGPVRIQWHEDYLVGQAGDKITAAKPFDGLRITDESGAANTVELAILSGDLSRSQIAQAVSINDSVPLNVNVATQTLSQYPALRQSKTFLGTGEVLTTNLTDNTQSIYFVLTNPAASGVVLIGCKGKFAVTNPTAGTTGTLILASSNDPLATILANLTGTQATQILNKNRLAAAGVGQLGAGYLQSSNGYGQSTNPGTVATDNIQVINDPASQPLVSEFSDGGLIIGPGQSLLYRVLPHSINEGSMAAGIEWIEQPV